MDWVEMPAAETGLPVGIRSAVGDREFWADLTELMTRSGRGVDFVNIDGDEGGTGPSPLVFTDSVALRSGSGSAGAALAGTHRYRNPHPPAVGPPIPGNALDHAS